MPLYSPDLDALGEDAGPAMRANARLLFARVLEATGGGLKIQTIHSFSQALLAAFPLEAGLVPGFTPLDDRGRAELARGALIALLDEAEAQLDRRLLDAVAALAMRLGEAGTLAYLARCVPAGPVLDLFPVDLETALLDQFDLPTGDLDAYLADACADTRFPVASLRRIAAAFRAWTAPTGQKAAAALDDWLASGPPSRRTQIGTILGHLLTKEGRPKNATNKSLLAAEADFALLCADVGGALASLSSLEAQVAYVRLAAQGLEAGRAYAAKHRAAMRTAGAVDFDDLISRARSLLGQEEIGAWIRFKLDQRIDHILVDEAQDTNDAQWEIVHAIVGDYFETESDAMGRALRTLFVVGDTKQAIFGFQGTSPRAFNAALDHFRALADRAQQPFDELPLALSFRSVPAILELVDETLAGLGASAIGLTEEPPRHRSARAYPGRVLLWPATFSGPNLDAESDDDSDPEGDETWLSDHHRLHAQKIAAQVKAWLDEPLWLASQGRAAKAGDVLILVRSRGALARLIVARLYEAGVPVAGVDRLRLQAPLAVRDLLAGLRFGVQPEDDLNLASLLVSPLIGWSQDDLMNWALRDKGVSLWSHLRATRPEDDLASLRDLLAAADYTTPYRQLESMLSGAMGGRAKLVARLGEEARDAIEELLNSALAFEKNDHPSLQRFLAWFDRDDADIKRELAEADDAVRVMTVHGAKGLEAPIVILADATYDPSARPHASAVDYQASAHAVIPMLPPRKGETLDVLQAAADEMGRLDSEEHWRLLYVALTRAQEVLAVSGALGPRAKGIPPLESWHATVEAALRRLGAEPCNSRAWGPGVVWEGSQDLPAAPAKPEAAKARAPDFLRPAWLDMKAPREARPPRPLAPSAAIEDDVPDPPPRPAQRHAATRGRLLHALFERLPAVQPEQRRDAARAWLAVSGAMLAEDARAGIVEHALAVIEHPDHGALFAPETLAETPIAAVVGETVIAGTVDRLVVRADRVHVVDFKTGRSAPEEASAVPLAHVRQMAAYVAALEVIFPGRTVEASLLYTAEPRLITLPDALLVPYKPGFAPAQD